MKKFVILGGRLLPLI